MEIKNKTFKFRPKRACDGPGSPTNDERADWAEIGIIEYARRAFDACDERNVRAYSVGDFLCNLMHFCDREKIDFSGCLKAATGSYEEER